MKRINKILFIIAAAISVLGMLIPLVVLPLFAILTPPQYENTYNGALNEKYDRLNSIEEDKIVVIGGSSVAFGLDSPALEEYTGMPVVNFGLYAALGTKVMLDLSKSGIKEGDVVILSPEMDSQTLSLYFSAENTLQALDGSFYMMQDIPIDNWFSLLGGMWKFTTDKLDLIRDGVTLNPSGIYNSANFNEQGDLDPNIFPRDENVMGFPYFDTNNLITLDESMPGEGFSEFCDYLNDYIDWCEDRGATVYFAWCPMNERSVTDTDEDTLSAFESYMKERIDCKFLGDIGDSILDAAYFYNSNLHLNETGAAMRTAALALEICYEIGKYDANIPPAWSFTPPELPMNDVYFGGVDENARYFTYTTREDGALIVTGLSAEGRAKTHLTLPLGADYTKVVEIAEGAFANSSVECLVIPEGTNLRVIENGAFSGASNLLRLEIYSPISADEAMRISPPDGFSGTADGFRIHVGDPDYLTDYYWSRYRSFIVADL